MSGNEIGVLDSLPYTDAAVPESYEDYAMSLIDAEMRKGTPKPVPELPPLPEGLEPQESSTKDEPELSLPTSGNIEDFRKAVRKARIAYEKERLLSEHLEVAKSSKTGGDVSLWKKYIPTMEATRNSLQKAKNTQEGAVQRINYSRQQEQQQVAQVLTALEHEYQQRLQKINDLRMAVNELRAQTNG